MGQNAKYHAEDQPQCHPTRTPHTTTALSDRQIARIEQQVIRKLETSSRETETRKTSRPAQPQQKKKRPPKQYGKHKRKRHR